jgi:adenylate cyclase
MPLSLLAKSDGPPQGASQLRVLLVDDQPMIGEAIRRCLANESDVEFHYCRDPATALSDAADFQPTVILQDLVMPDVDGLQLLRFFRSQASTALVPMIMLSSRDEGVVKAKSFELGANDYVVKLPESVELVARIRYHSQAYINARDRQAYLQALEQEQARSEDLLRNVLPNDVVAQLKQGEKVNPILFNEVTVLFADIVGFTQLSTRISPIELVETLQYIFDQFDRLVHEFQVEKIKTIGDAYMAVSGVPSPCSNHAQRMAQLAIGMQRVMAEFRDQSPYPIDLRVGLASGPVVAGIIGTTRFIYDLWGDTVNTASRMESHGEPGAIHVTEATAYLLQSTFRCEPRGEVAIKGKGNMVTAWLRERL